MIPPVHDELYAVEQTYLGPPRRYLGPDAAQGELRVARDRTLDVVVTDKLGLPFTVLTVRAAAPSPSRSSNAGAPAGSKAWPVCSAAST
jgi:hypothetical protein